MVRAKRALTQIDMGEMRAVALSPFLPRPPYQVLVISYPELPPPSLRVLWIVLPQTKCMASGQKSKIKRKQIERDNCCV